MLSNSRIFENKDFVDSDVALVMYLRISVSYAKRRPPKSKFFVRSFPKGFVAGKELPAGVECGSR